LQQSAARRYGIPIVSEYGMTECPAIMGMIAGTAPPGSIGKPLPEVDVRLVDEDGEPVTDGEVGELVVRSPNVMQGYFDDPAATAAILRDGWVFTGDLARRDEAGYYYLAGRQILRINVGGFKVAPEEVEAVLLRHPGVREAAVAGQPDQARGEVVRAIIV